MRIDQMHYNFELECDRVASNDRPDFMPWEIDEYLNKAIWKFLKTRYSIYNEIKQGFETNEKRISELASLHIKSPELQPEVAPIDLGNGRYEIRLNSLGDNIDGQYFRYLFLTDALLKVQKGDCTKVIPHTQWQIDDIKTAYRAASWKWNRVLVNFGKSTFNTPPIVSPVVADSMDVTANLIDDYSLVTERFNNDQLKSMYIDTTDRNGNQEFIVTGACISYIKYPNRVFVGGYDHLDKHSTSATNPIHCDIDEAFHDEIVRLAVSIAQEDIQDQFGVQVSAKKINEDKLL